MDDFEKIDSPTHATPATVFVSFDISEAIALSRDSGMT